MFCYIICKLYASIGEQDDMQRHKLCVPAKKLHVKKLLVKD